MTLLTETRETLPASWYYEPEHYTCELEAIWYRDWVCVGRQEDIPRTGDYLVRKIGSQSLIVTRGDDDVIRAFHNTCRHRGSILCTKSSGRFANGRIICPYHTWTYALTGELIATPHRVETEDFSASEFPLFDVHVDQWGGFVFVNLADVPAVDLATFLGEEAEALAGWPLAELKSVRREVKPLACNWKVFWENYSECYHCPRHHPELCRVVPAYGDGLMEDDEGVAPGKDAGLREGMQTWTMDGKIRLPILDGLSQDDIDRGMVFASFTASMFVVGHPDYVRSVRIYPTGPETTDLVVDWYLMPGTTDSHAADIEHMLELGRLVVEQDGALCDLNQAGLHSRAYDKGVLVPQEYWLWDFHEWVRERVDAVR